MPIYNAKVTKDLKIPIPPEMMERLSIKAGEEVEFFLTSEGQIHFHVLRNNFGEALNIKRVPPISIREMDDGIAESVIERNNRSLSQNQSFRKSAAE
jgi:bifunctional DNA-binding transcriptional regulator/antitoxin component of YhaV-PrlF toxin-antitoxin module